MHYYFTLCPTRTPDVILWRCGWAAARERCASGRSIIRWSCGCWHSRSERVNADAADRAMLFCDAVLQAVVVGRTLRCPDQISFVLEKEDESKVAEQEDVNEKVQKLEKPYIRTSARATILHLKRGGSYSRYIISLPSALPSLSLRFAARQCRRTKALRMISCFVHSDDHVGDGREDVSTSDDEFFSSWKLVKRKIYG